jgi:hypothetical protein
VGSERDDAHGGASVKPLTAEQFDLAYKGEQFRLGIEKLQKDLGVRMQIGWKGKHCYLQLVDAEAPSDNAITALKTTRDGRTRWCLDDEAQIAVRYERAHCGECGSTLAEVKR